MFCTGQKAKVNVVRIVFPVFGCSILLLVGISLAWLKFKGTVGTPPIS
jgi:hypothetical protein